MVCEAFFIGIPVTRPLHIGIRKMLYFNIPSLGDICISVYEKTVTEYKENEIILLMAGPSSFVHYHSTSKSHKVDRPHLGLYAALT